MTTTLIAGDFATGLIRKRGIPARSASVEAVLNQAGTIAASVTLPVVDPNTGLQDTIGTDIVPVRSFLGYVQDGVLVNAGPIWSEQWDAEKQSLSFSAAGAMSYFDYRYVLPALVATGSASVVGNPSTFGGTGVLSLNTIAKQLVQQAQAYGGPPIDFEADVAGGSYRTYQSEALKRVHDALSDLSNVIGGPDIMLVPYITADGNYVRWRLTTGSPLIQQSGQDVVWDTTANAPSAQSISVSRNGTTLATDGYEIGATIQSTDGNTSTVLSSASHDSTLIGQGILPLEVSESRTDVTVQSTLDGYAQSLTIDGRFYTDTWSFKSRLGLPPLIGDISPGIFGQLRYSKHPVLGTGPTRVRILSVALSLADAYATLACAPQRSA